MKQLKFTKKWFNKETKEIFLLFLGWRFAIFFFALIGIYFLPLYSQGFLGGGFERYTKTPLFWGWSNFDGEHYLFIAQNGYQSLKHAFFPVYPLLIGYLGSMSGGITSLAVVGLLVSNLSFLISLVLFWKLVILDYSKKIAFLSVFILLSFPTSFYFGALYTESLFLVLVLGSFYAARKNQWLLAGILGAVASATRVMGIFLFPALFLEWRQMRKEGKTEMYHLLFICMVPIGIISYMLFLKGTTGDPLAFYTLQAISGEQRDQRIIPLYQVFWRYVKMISTFDPSNPIYITILMEALTGAGAFLLLVVGYLRKMRPSYLSFSFLSYILPTLTGSFSSMPRYVLAIFPFFILLATLIYEKDYLRKIFLVASAIALVAETMLFIRGYWVA